MSDQSRVVPNLKRTRRNILTIGVIVATASISRVERKSAHACGLPCACYLRGTHILTPAGEQKIETLQIGDSVVSASGETKPIEWIGRRVFRRAAGSDWVESIRPVRIANGALGPEIPRRDLFVSQEHCLFIDGVLMRAIDLVNGSSITLDSGAGCDEIEYLHIKLAAHDVILAEGAPSETMLLHADSFERYDNFAEYARLRDKRVATEEAACAPIVWTKGNRDRVRSRLRSALSPWYDRRTVFDKARDRLEERAEALFS
jgi:hypothetical protein